jgi:hypothetical protein
MRPDDTADWVDRVMTGTLWEPPHDFTARVVARAMTALPQRKPQLDLLTYLRSIAIGVVQSMRGRIEGPVWVLLQYRQLFGRS